MEKLEATVNETSKIKKDKNLIVRDEFAEKTEFNPSYEVMNESYGVNPYSVDCCRCNPQRC